MPRLIINATQKLFGRSLNIRRQSAAAPAVHAPAVVKTQELVGQTVWMEEHQVAGKVTAQHGKLCTVQIALPNDKGMLVLSDTMQQVDESSVTPEKMLVAEGKVKGWSLYEEFDVKMVEVKDGDVIVDYRDVYVEGMASTFAKVTPADRDGDVVMDNAFDETLTEFRKNPVMLMDHKNSVHSIAGSFDRIGVFDKGLGVRGRVSNAPELTKIRFLIVEKHLKAFSMGGLFFYGPDGRTIQKVNLFEVSLVAVPANQDALFSVRSLTVEEARKAFARHKSFGIGFAKA